jgi:hypothetical protein
MAAGTTYTPIATTTVGTATNTVTFSSISGSYTDLVIVINGIASGGGMNPTIQFNGDTASNYSLTWVYGNGTAAFTSRYSSQTSAYIGYLSSSEQGNIVLQVQNYSNATTNKTTLFRWNTVSIETGAGVALWRNTAAITSISFKTSANNYGVGTTFTLYGIAAA